MPIYFDHAATTAMVEPAITALTEALKKLGLNVKTKLFFDTIIVECDAAKVLAAGVTKEINFRHIDSKHIGISLDQTIEQVDLNDIVSCFAGSNIEVAYTASNLISNSNSKGIL